MTARAAAALVTREQASRAGDDLLRWGCAGLEPPYPFPELGAWSMWGPSKYLPSELISKQRKPLLGPRSIDFILKRVKALWN